MPHFLQRVGRVPPAVLLFVHQGLRRLRASVVSILLVGVGFVSVLETEAHCESWSLVISCDSASFRALNRFFLLIFDG